MKTNFIPHTFVAIAMIFLLWSCGIDPNVDSAKMALAESDYEEVISSSKTAIEENPENGNGYYYLGIAHAFIAREKPPEERLEDFRTFRENFDKARQRYEEQSVSSEEANNINDIILELWGNEYNAGIQPLTDDIISSPEDSLQLARHHFQNAIAINPDSVQSYNLLAEVHFALGNLEEAEEITHHVIYDMQNDDIFNYYRLSYYLMERDRNQEALEVLSDARELYPDEMELIQEIANLYLNMGETDKALETVQELIERDPENPQYRLVYATQVYQMVQNIDNETRAKHDAIYDLSREVRELSREPNSDEAEINRKSDQIDELMEEADELIEESFRLSEQAEEELLAALENNPENPDILSTLGVIYQNRAAVLQDKRNLSEDDEEAERYDEQAKENLRKALPHFEKAAELEEDNLDHWRSLFRVYTNLGMNEKAEYAQEKAGL